MPIHLLATDQLGTDLQVSDLLASNQLATDMLDDNHDH